MDDSRPGVGNNSVLVERTMVLDVDRSLRQFESHSIPTLTTWRKSLVLYASDLVSLMVLIVVNDVVDS